MNTEFITLDVISLKATLEGKATIKAGTTLRSYELPLEHAKAYFARLVNLRSHKTIANLAKMPQSEYANPQLESGYGLDENGFLIKGGEYLYEAKGRVLNTKKVSKPKTTKTDK